MDKNENIEAEMEYKWSKIANILTEENKKRLYDGYIKYKDKCILSGIEFVPIYLWALPKIKIIID